MPDTNAYTINKADLSDDDLFRLNSALSSVASRIATLEAANQGLFTGTVALAPLTVGGKSGTLTLVSGKATTLIPST